MQDHYTLDPPAAPMEYALAQLYCETAPGGVLNVTPTDLEELRYCPFCGEALDEE